MPNCKRAGLLAQFRATFGTDTLAFRPHLSPLFARSNPRDTTPIWKCMPRLWKGKRRHLQTPPPALFDEIDIAKLQQPPFFGSADMFTQICTTIATLCVCGQQHLVIDLAVQLIERGPVMAEILEVSRLIHHAPAPQRWSANDCIHATLGHARRRYLTA